KLKEAASFGQPITEYDPGSRGYKDFVNLARELMGYRPMEIEQTPADKLSRPAELVQRAKQLAQLTNFQFGRNSIQGPATTVISERPAQPMIPVGSNGNGNASSNGNGNGNGNGHSSRLAQYEMPEPPPIQQQRMPEPPKTTAQKIEEFYGVKQIGDEVVFAA